MNMRSILSLGLVFTSCLALSATAHAENVKDAMEMAGQYWQRVSTSSAIYMQGPKAQQILNRDIARCVVELRELERLGDVKDAIPEYAEGVILSEDEARLAGWDTPERDEELFAEQGNYHDFEACMLAKGWERVKYVPFDVAEQAQNNYLQSHAAYKDVYDSMGNKKKPDYNEDYDNFNN